MRRKQSHRRSQGQRREGVKCGRGGTRPSRGFGVSCLLFFLLPLAFSLHTLGAQQAWVATYNLGPQSTNQAVAIALDLNGDIIVAGHGSAGSTGYDYIILKYSPVGTQVWTRTYASSGSLNDQVRSMKVDNNGNIFVTGTSETLMYSSGGTLLWNQPYAGRALAVDGDHVYVTGFSNTVFATAKLLKADGSNVWLRTFTVKGGPDGPSEAIALDSNTNVFVAGANTCYDFRGIRYNDMYASGYASAGADLWRKGSHYGCILGSLSVKAIMVDSVNNIYVLANAISHAGAYYTLKFDSQGNRLWWYYLQGLVYDAGRAMALDSQGFVYLTGASHDLQSLQFGTVKLDATSGTNIWHRQYGGVGGDEATAMQLGADGNVYVTGDSSNGTDPSDMATLSYDPDGNVRWIKRFNGPVSGSDRASAIAVSPNGDVYVTGLSTTSSNLIELTTIKYIQVAPIEKKSNGGILLSFSGAPGSNYIIQACSTLTNWTNIGSATASSSGLYTFEDTNAPAHLQRFYRAMQE